jgi:hypothetical protein
VYSVCCRCHRLLRTAYSVTASTLDLAPGLFLIGLGADASLGQLFDFILAGVTMDEVGSASGVLEARSEAAW